MSSKVGVGTALISALAILGGTSRGQDASPARPANPPRTDQQLLKDLGLGGDGPALVKFFRLRSRGPIEDFPAADFLRRLGHADFKVREQASAELLALGPPALPALRRMLQGQPELEVRRRLAVAIEAIEHHPGPALPAAAARLLRQRKADGATPALLAYLPDRKSVV